MAAGCLSRPRRGVFHGVGCTVIFPVIRNTRLLSHRTYRSRVAPMPYRTGGARQCLFARPWVVLARKSLVRARDMNCLSV